MGGFLMGRVWHFGRCMGILRYRIRVLRPCIIFFVYQSFHPPSSPVSYVSAAVRNRLER